MRRHEHKSVALHDSKIALREIDRRVFAKHKEACRAKNLGDRLALVLETLPLLQERRAAKALVEQLERRQAEIDAMERGDNGN